MKQLITKLKYQNCLGSVILDNVEVHLDKDDYEKYNKGVVIENLDYGLSGITIEEAERQIAINFYSKRYDDIYDNRIPLKIEELNHVQQFFNINKEKFYRLVCINKKQLLNNKKISRLTGLKVMYLLFDFIRKQNNKYILNKKLEKYT